VADTTVNRLRRFQAAGELRRTAPPEGDLPVLQALLHISQAVLAADYFDEVLEVIAEESLALLEAASISISRWDRDRQVLRTLINAGDLQPGDDRWPHDEVYPVLDDRHVLALLQQGQPYTNAVDDPEVDDACAEILRQLGRESEVAVPVMSGGSIWGEIWASGTDGRRFGPDDVQLLQAVATHVAVAISRSELFSTVWRYAYQDPLTGLANRRALDKFFIELEWAAVDPVLLLCDLDGLKQVNDTAGHPAGDTLLCRVASTLADAAAVHPGSLVVRLGGDEFCVVLVRSTLADAEQFARQASRQLAAPGLGPITLSWGAADVRTGMRGGHDLVAAADSALLEAKRLGRGWFRTTSAELRTASADERRRSDTDDAGRNADRLIPRIVGLFDRDRPLTALAALEIVATEAHRAINAAAWTISAVTDGGRAVQTLCGVDSKRDPVSGLRVLKTIDPSTSYPLQDYPATAEVLGGGCAFLAAVDLEGSDPAEVALLVQHGYRAVLAIGLVDGDERYLLEIFSDVGHADLDAVSPHLRVLTQYCTAVAHA
jgi:diguanylate cyclase (GGDEF)-like protein